MFDFFTMMFSSYSENIPFLSPSRSFDLKHYGVEGDQFFIEKINIQKYISP